MALMLKQERDGTLRQFWYGVYTVNGKRTVRNLNIPWRGKPPASLRVKGSRAFEASRKEANAKLEEMRDQAATKGRAEHLTLRLIEDKTGRKPEYVRVADLAARWRGLPRESVPGEHWLRWCDTVFNRFAETLGRRFLHEVTPQQASAYVESLQKTFARKTARGAAQLLKSAFARLLPLGTTNPFDGGIRRKSGDVDGDTIHRRPFTSEELAKLFATAREDAFLYPLVVTAACTGLRRGDVCRLQWSAIDLKAGVVAVKTSKTGACVEIPIFKPLREVLEAALAVREEGSAHVFPEAARMQRENDTGLTWRFKKLVAGMMTDGPEEAVIVKTAEPARAGLSEALEAVQAAVKAELDGPRLERVTDTLRRYAAGESVRMIEKATGCARSTVSADLHLAESVSGRRFMPVAANDGGVKGRIEAMTRTGQKGRNRRASVLDWHALRVTWVTLAISAGVPIEVARLVTGHKTVEVVLRHYFKPGREHLRAVLGDKLPAVLTGGKASEEESLAAKVAAGHATPEERKRLAMMLV